MTDRIELIRQRLRRFVERPRYEYRRLHALLAREGHPLNHEPVHRLNREGGLAVRRRVRKRVCRRRRKPPVRAERLNHAWSMDSMGGTIEPSTDSRLPEV